MESEALRIARFLRAREARIPLDENDPDVDAFIARVPSNDPDRAAWTLQDVAEVWRVPAFEVRRLADLGLLRVTHDGKVAPRWVLEGATARELDRIALRFEVRELRRVVYGS